MVSNLTSIARWAMALASLFVLCFPAVAADSRLNDCSAALLYNRTVETSTFSAKISRLLHVSEESWRTMKTSASADVVYEGIPLGGSYADFQESVFRLTRTLNINEDYRRSTSKVSEEVSKDSFSAFIRCMEISSNEPRITFRFDPGEDTLTITFLFRTFSTSTEGFYPSIKIEGAGLMAGQTLDDEKEKFQKTKLGDKHRTDISIIIPLTDPEQSVTVTINGTGFAKRIEETWTGIPPALLRWKADAEGTDIRPLTVPQEVIDAFYLSSPTNMHLFPANLSASLKARAYDRGTGVEISVGALANEVVRAIPANQQVRIEYKLKQIFEQGNWKVAMAFSQPLELVYYDNYLKQRVRATEDIRICQTKRDRDKNKATDLKDFKACIEPSAIEVKSDTLRLPPP